MQKERNIKGFKRLKKSMEERSDCKIKISTAPIPTRFQLSITDIDDIGKDVEPVLRSSPSCKLGSVGSFRKSID